jgi:hypothetical protein
MSRNPSNSDWVRQKLESARRRVNQLEIDACRIRTDLVQIEVANATGLITEELPHPSHIETHVANADASALDWQPAADAVPEGMEILVGSPQSESPTATPIAEPLASDAESPESPTASPLASPSRRVYRRISSPMMSSLVVHSAVLFVSASITVATVYPDRVGPVVVNLAGDKSQETEVDDVKQLADLGEATPTTPEAEVLKSAELAEFAALGPDPVPIDLKSLDGPVSVGQLGVPSALPTDLCLSLTTQAV